MNDSEVIELDDLDGFSLAHVDDEEKSESVFWGEILRDKRLALQLTQKTVAKKAGISPQCYQAFESGKRNICTASFGLACKIIEALTMNVSKFFHGDYVLGELVYLKDNQLYYVASNRPINEEILDKD